MEAYLQRLAWSNELFSDDITVEGIVQLPGEDDVRVVTTQPWHVQDKKTPHPEQTEIDQYMRDRGFLRAYDGAYIHESRDIVATDALPKNFVEDRNGILHPIDVILTEPGSDQHERLTNMARSQTQLEKTAETQPPPRMQHSQQSGRHESDARINLDVAKFRNILEHGDSTPLPADLPGRVQRAVAGSTRGGIQDSEVHVRQLDGVQLRSGQDDARIASAVAALFGRRVVGFDVWPKQFGGGLTNSGIPDAVLVNIAAEKPAMIITGHELWHHLQLEHSDIANAVRKQMEPEIIAWRQTAKSYGNEVR